MKDDIVMSREAARILTVEQLGTISHLVGEEHKIEVRAPFMGSPKNWVEFVLLYKSGGSIYGGISPEGDAHT